MTDTKKVLLVFILTFLIGMYSITNCINLDLQKDARDMANELYKFKTIKYGEIYFYDCEITSHIKIIRSKIKLNKHKFEEFKNEISKNGWIYDWQYNVSDEIIGFSFKKNNMTCEYSYNPYIEGDYVEFHFDITLD